MGGYSFSPWCEGFEVKAFEVKTFEIVIWNLFRFVILILNHILNDFPLNCTSANMSYGDLSLDQMNCFGLKYTKV